METVHSIVGRADGQYPTRCSFFLPVAEGRSPKPVEIAVGRARALLPQIVASLASAREAERSRYEPLGAKAVETILSLLVAFGDIRPQGYAVVASMHPTKAATTAGHVSATLRIAYIGPAHKDSADVLIHEFAHLGGAGEVDDLAVLLDPTTLEPCATRVLNAGWIRTSCAPVERWQGKWNWNDPAFILQGHFFEEAMAQLVALRALTATKPILAAPVVFQGNQLIFELPVEYGHSAAGWSMLQLENLCPGVVQTLIAGARGNADYQRLEDMLEARVPGLFRRLYDITPSAEIVVGVEQILKRLGPTSK